MRKSLALSLLLSGLFLGSSGSAQSLLVVNQGDTSLSIVDPISAKQIAATRPTALTAVTTLAAADGSDERRKPGNPHAERHGFRTIGAKRAQHSPPRRTIGAKGAKCRP